MDAGTTLFSFAAILPYSPARPPPPPQLPPPPLASASRSSPAPLACHLNLPFFNPKIVSSSSRLRLLLACGDDTSSSSTPPPEETRGRQQWLALRLCDLGCAWAAASRAYAPVAASAVRPSAKEDEGDSVRRQGFLGC